MTSQLPRRNLLVALGLALAATGVGGPLGVARRAAAAVGAATVPGAGLDGFEDVTRPPRAYPGLFNSRESALEGLLSLMPKAAALRIGLASDTATLVPAGTGGPGTWMTRWNALLAEIRGAEPMAQLVAVNDFLNKVAYVSDRRNYRVDDYWATPAEFFAAGGDCEDYALAKFVSLYRLGYNEDRLRVAIVYDEKRRMHHAFLAVYLADDIYLLDNQIEAVTSHRQVSHYRPICSFDSHRLWVHAA
jgi:predicted transglutaminase-like cysteine proteinase